MTRDFALRQPHQYARKDRSIVSSGEVYYYFESSSDDEHDLRRVITLAQSWTFLGMAANVLPVASLREERTADCISKIKTFVFSIFSGDTFLVVDLPLTGKPGSESN